MNMHTNVSSTAPRTARPRAGAAALSLALAFGGLGGVFLTGCESEPDSAEDVGDAVGDAADDAADAVDDMDR